MQRSIDYEGLAVFEGTGTKEPVDITIHVEPTRRDAERSPSVVDRERTFAAIEVWVKEDVLERLGETAKVTILTRSPVGLKVVTGFRLDIIDREHTGAAAPSGDVPSQPQRAAATSRV